MSDPARSSTHRLRGRIADTLEAIARRLRTDGPREPSRFVSAYGIPPKPPREETHPQPTRYDCCRPKIKFPV